MSWFHKDRGGKVHPILKHVDHTIILGAVVEHHKLTKLCYTGHAGISESGVVQAIVPGGELLWRADLSALEDVSDGHCAAHAGVVVTRVRHGKTYELVAHDMWTGEEKWKKDVGQMVTRMGIDGDHLVFVTFDHAVHAIAFATGEDSLRKPVMTDQAASTVINHTQHPVRAWGRTGSSRASDDWSGVYHAAKGLEVYERDWAGTSEFGVGFGGDVHIVGSGGYDGILAVGDVIVIGFKLDTADGRHHHWYFYEQGTSHLLAVLREDGKSDVYDNGKKWWSGKL